MLKSLQYHRFRVIREQEYSLKKVGVALILAALLALLPAVLAAENNLQKIYPVESELYEKILFLHMEQGISPPWSSGPWSGAELQTMLARINRTALSPQSRQLYDSIAVELATPEAVEWTPGFNAAFHPVITLEGYSHLNTRDPGSFTSERDWLHDYEARSPMLSFPLETWAGETIYTYFTLPVAVNQFRESNTTATLFNHPFTTNILFLPPNTIYDLNVNVPYRIFASLGTESWNIQLGRDRVRWGSGTSGNLILGGHLLYNDYARFTTAFRDVKYTVLGISFPHPMNYRADMETDPSLTLPIRNDLQQGDPLTGLKLFIAHRAEIRLADRLNVALTEAIMYMSEDNYFNLQLLNPLMIYHDYFIRGNSNSLLGLDLEYTPFNRITLYGQFLIDEMNIPGEDSARYPEAVGILAGIRGISPIGTGYLYGTCEGIYTDPYLYLRDNGSLNQQGGDYGINFIAAIREYSRGDDPIPGSISYMEDFLGYEYGNDVIGLHAEIGYVAYGRFRVEGSLDYRLHGTHDMYTLWQDGLIAPEAPQAVSPTQSPASGNQDPAAEERDAVETTITARLRAEAHLSPALRLSGDLGWVMLLNPGNLSDAAPAQDLQLTVGITFTL